MKRVLYIALTLISLIAKASLVKAEPETLIRVELKSGAHANRFEVTQEHSSCLYGTSNGDDWRTLYGVDTAVDTQTMSTVLLLIPSTTAAASGSTDFFFSAGFGEYSSDEYLEYILDPQSGNGSGTVTVQRDGSHATLSIAGQTSEGVSLNATIVCNMVLEMSLEPKALSELAAIRFAPDSTAPTGSLSLTIADKTYQVKTGDEVTCGYVDYDPNGLFSYSYYLEGYTYFDVFIPNFEVGQTTSAFGVALDNFYVAYRTGEGSGTVASSQEGNTLTLEVDIQSPEGIPVQATLVCFLE